MRLSDFLSMYGSSSVGSDRSAKAQGKKEESEQARPAYALLTWDLREVDPAHGLPVVLGASYWMSDLEDSGELFTDSDPDRKKWKIVKVEIVPSGYSPVLHMTLDHREGGRSFGPDSSFVVYDNGRVYGFFKNKKHAEEWILSQKATRKGREGHPLQVFHDAVHEKHIW